MRLKRRRKGGLKEGREGGGEEEGEGGRQGAWEAGRRVTWRAKGGGGQTEGETLTPPASTPRHPALAQLQDNLKIPSRTQPRRATHPHPGNKAAASRPARRGPRLQDVAGA